MHDQLQPDIVEDDEAESINMQFQQWITVDRSELVQQILPLEDFISLLVEKRNTATTHSYIAKAQAKYLKKCKEELKANEVIVLGDFAESYQFVIQDEIQGFHWNKQSCTLHPIVIYYKKDNILTQKSICFISDDLNHDTRFVYEVMKQTVNIIKEIFTEPIMMHYFSDGCAGQYKNCKNFINLCLHEKDFNIKCVWSFFATSHDKSPCDGLGGTLKHLTARASLQRTLSDQILTAKQVFDYCKEEVKGVHVSFISTEDMIPVRSMLDARFQKLCTLPGTRSFHQFVPLSESLMAAKRVSEDQSYGIEFNLVLGEENTVNMTKDPKVSDFAVCSYDEEYWIGLIDEVDEEHDDVKVKFMHPSYPARSFSWPKRDDTCFVPIVNVAFIIGAPMTITGRQYKLDDYGGPSFSSYIQHKYI